MPGITSLLELYQEHLEQKLGKKVSPPKIVDHYVDPDLFTNTHINKLLSLPTGGNSKKERKVNYHIIDL